MRKKKKANNKTPPIVPCSEGFSIQQVGNFKRQRNNFSCNDAESLWDDDLYGIQHIYHTILI